MKKAQKARKATVARWRGRKVVRELHRSIRARSKNGRSRDQGKLVIRQLPAEWRQVFRALAILQGMDNAQLLVWLLRTHPEVRAREGRIRGGTVTAHSRPAAPAAR